MAYSLTTFVNSPARSLFRYCQFLGNEPLPLPPPHFGDSFTIPDDWYQAALSFRVPITIAVVYAVTAKALNKYNISTGKKPWGISKTVLFRLFLVIHNVFLAVYSAWTCWGMLHALHRSIVSPSGPDGLAGTVDSFCKLHGPGGFGNAVAFNQAQGQWETHGNGIPRNEGSPSRADAGRLWNEGLAFYGWIFYLSKFYEVLDTFIILAQGKLSSTLQTYHHAGAMMCMWAGMRFMSAPIWMFVFVNSGIHAMMYTYYSVTAFNIRVPTAIKRTLTTLQIIQFVTGAPYAMVHTFVSYTVPVNVLRTTAATEVISRLAATASTMTSHGYNLNTPKSLVVGAAEATNSGTVASAGAPSPLANAGEKVVYQTVPCITSVGATFAIWLNVLYLAPLTYLFISFFIASYMKRNPVGDKRARKQENVDDGGRRLSNDRLTAEQAGWDAVPGIEEKVYSQGSN